MSKQMNLLNNADLYQMYEITIEQLTTIKYIN